MCITGRLVSLDQDSEFTVDKFTLTSSSSRRSCVAVQLTFDGVSISGGQVSRVYAAVTSHLRSTRARYNRIFETAGTGDPAFKDLKGENRAGIREIACRRRWRRPAAAGEDIRI